MRWARHVFVVVVAALIGCATASRTAGDSTGDVPLNARERVVALARKAASTRARATAGVLAGVDNGCTGFIENLFLQVGIRLDAEGHVGDTPADAILRYAERHGRLFREGRPIPGDLVFLRDPASKMRPVLHVGVVESVDEAGTVSVLQWARGGVVRFRMNPSRPNERADASTGIPLNDLLRADTLGEPAGILFDTYASILPSDLTPEGLPRLRPEPKDSAI